MLALLYHLSHFYGLKTPFDKMLVILLKVALYRYVSSKPGYLLQAMLPPSPMAVSQRSWQNDDGHKRKKRPVSICTESENQWDAKCGTNTAGGNYNLERTLCSNDKDTCS